MHMLKGHLAQMQKAERAIARAAQVYAEQGHEELFQKTSEVLRHARLASGTVKLVLEAESQARDFREGAKKVA
jgi:hypothetical protein